MPNNIKIKKIQELIQVATEVTKQLKNPYKIRAFGILFKFLLEQKKYEIMDNVLKNDMAADGRESLNNKIKKFQGLVGGIEYLIEEGFFERTRMLKEIYTELIQNGYHYPKTSLPSALLPLIRKKQLTRIREEDGLWCYVIRK